MKIYTIPMYNKIHHDAAIARATAKGSTFRMRRPRRSSAQFFKMYSACRLPVRAKY